MERVTTRGAHRQWHADVSNRSGPTGAEAASTPLVGPPRCRARKGQVPRAARSIQRMSPTSSSCFDVSPTMLRQISSTPTPRSMDPRRPNPFVDCDPFPASLVVVVVVVMAAAAAPREVVVHSCVRVVVPRGRIPWCGGDRPNLPRCGCAASAYRPKRLGLVSHPVHRLRVIQRDLVRPPFGAGCCRMPSV